ncbi:protein kinase, putative [Trichomonas vaginalis G3]|uniref:Protein kinase, putative n=1 Tax=Trichomonas vaginalis (strain ATCC PRA-98 / G3) TaxID=412133 RepID=A2DEA5_TRIV3|nr:eukaryotic translation initiation factor 2alpha kinase protein [Trichomonas vaginalis G3]EAY21323.1 protein kinase, putative [Trichomonas vaginalis G3]KAI5548940.1 eukaryotic translation initiation factor 2alpha kinase protein [Trichomonas vaginalis G3]|eukprot:XP_001582309.1 protein kinase [Trichomonas vaginalis G3]
MNRGYQEEIDDILKGEFTYEGIISPYSVTFNHNDKSIHSLKFIIPIKYPRIPPSVSFTESSKKKNKDISDNPVDTSIISKILLQSKNTDYLSTIANEISFQLKGHGSTIDQADHISDAFETLKLQIQARLAEDYRKQWFSEQKNARINVQHNFVDYEQQFLLYSLYSALNGEKPLEKCKEFLEKNFNFFMESKPTKDQIENTIVEAFSQDNIAPSIKQLFIVQRKYMNGKENNLSSRFTDDFSIIYPFGVGYIKASNIVDNRVYTVQCMIIKKPEEEKKIKEVVKALTSLQHRNLVRYYNSWVETCDGALAKLINDDFKLVKKNQKRSLTREEAIDFSTITQDYGELEEEEENPENPELTTYFFIQTEYCHNRSLTDILQDMSYPDINKSEITRQILEILHYIHSNGIVHNNLSTDCIYVDDNYIIKLGGFGLNTIVNPDSAVNTKSDMESFAYILFKLFYTRSTETTLEDIRLGKLPTDWSFAFPIEAKIVSLLVQPNKRPSALDLLQWKIIKTNPKEKTNKDISKYMGFLTSESEKPGKYFREVISTFFSDTRRLPFRFDDFRESSNSQNQTFEIRGQVMRSWYDICSKNNALYFNTPFIRNVSGKPSKDSVTLMLPDSSLIDLRSNLTDTYEQWMQENSVRSKRLFSCMLQFNWESNDKHSQVEEEENFTYSVIEPTDSIEYYIECAMTAITLFHKFISNTQIRCDIFHPIVEEFLKDNYNIFQQGSREVIRHLENSKDARYLQASRDIDMFVNSCGLEYKHIKFVSPNFHEMKTSSMRMTLKIVNDVPIATIFQMRDQQHDASITSVHIKILDFLHQIGKQTTSKRNMIQVTVKGISSLSQKDKLV